MTTTLLPIDSILAALDLLINHRVLEESEADFRLNQWLEENNLTVNDLNN